MGVMTSGRGVLPRGGAETLNMENDQATRLRALVRDARRLAVLRTGPPLVAIVRAAGMAPDVAPAQFAADMAEAARLAGVALAADGRAPADWVYTLLPTEEEGGRDTWGRASVALLLSQSSPSAVLATYAWIKQQFGRGPMPPLKIVFANTSPAEAARAFDGLNATCQRFLGTRLFTWSVWDPQGEPGEMANLVEELRTQLSTGVCEESVNPLAEMSLEGV
jgi:hypothetical protein